MLIRSPPNTARILLLKYWNLDKKKLNCKDKACSVLSGNNGSAMKGALRDFT